PLPAYTPLPRREPECRTRGTRLLPGTHGFSWGIPPQVNSRCQGDSALTQRHQVLGGRNPIHTKVVPHPNASFIQELGLEKTLFQSSTTNRNTGSGIPVCLNKKQSEIHDCGRGQYPK